MLHYKDTNYAFVLKGDRKYASQILAHAANRNKHTSKKCSRSLFGACFVVASAVNLLSLEPKQEKWILNAFCFLTGQIDIPEPSLTLFYAVMIECFLRLFL